MFDRLIATLVPATGVPANIVAVKELLDELRAFDALLKMRDRGNPQQEILHRVQRRQGGKLFELGAATSFARLLRTQGKTKEARMMLAEIYKWFPEGLDTADLREAKILHQLGD